MNCYFCDKELKNFDNGRGDILYLVCYNCCNSNLVIKHFYQSIYTKELYLISFDVLIAEQEYGVDFDVRYKQTRLYQLPETYLISIIDDCFTPKNVFVRLPMYLTFS